MCPPPIRVPAPGVALLLLALVLPAVPPPAQADDLAEFEARAAALARSVEALAPGTAPAPGPPGDLPEEFDLGDLDGPAADAGGAATPATSAPPGLDEFERRIALLFPAPARAAARISQTLVGELSDSSFTSAAEGKTTTRVASVTHTLSLDRALGTGGDLALVNALELGRTRDRDVLDLGLTRQLEGSGEWGAAVHLELQRAKNGEVEPDYHLGELTARRLWDRFPASTVEVRAQARRQDYSSSDVFYLDSESRGIEVDAGTHHGRFDSALNAGFEAERFDRSPENDVDRLTADGSLTAAFGRLEARLSGSFQHEAIRQAKTLDPWRLRTGELALTRQFSPAFTLELAAGVESRGVDTLSRSNFDYLERQGRAVATLGLGPGLDATLTLNRATRRNRDKVPGDKIVEPADDQARTDLELYLGWTRGRLQASATAARGETRFLHGQSQAFADEDRRSLSASIGFRFDDSRRIDLSLSRDRASYPTFPVNDTRSDSITVSLTRSF